MNLKSTCFDAGAFSHIPLYFFSLATGCEFRDSHFGSFCSLLEMACCNKESRADKNSHQLTILDASLLAPPHVDDSLIDMMALI